MQPVLFLLFLPLFSIVVNGKTTGRRGVSLEDETFLQLLEVEIARTLRSELTSDDELQVLEGSGDIGEDQYFRKSFTTTSTTTEPTTTTTTMTTTTTTTTAPPPPPPTPTTTTTKPPPPQCVQEKDCFKDSECPLGKCLGSELGICDCNACVTNRKCESDADCGGLRNACDSSGYCDCVKAFHSHGYELFVKVLLTFCHQTKCSTSSDNCYGLPCRTGKCKCSPQTNSKLPVHYFTTG